MPETQTDQTKPINPLSVDGAATLNTKPDPIEDFRINIDSNDHYVIREIEEKQSLFAVAALAASSGNMHLPSEAIAKHAWNVAGAMITEGQARGLIPLRPDTEEA